MMTEEQPAVSTISIRQHVIIHAPRDTVWKSLTQDTDSWWDHRHFKDSAVIFEPVAGGFFGERGPSGEAHFATVQRVVPRESIAMIGPMGMRIPCTNLMTYTLEDEGEATRLTIEHLGTGPFTDEHRSGYGQGWKELLEGRLKPHCESLV